MRFLNGVVIGILLTVGAAYMHDRTVAGDGPERQLVNWSEFGRAMDGLSGWVHEQFVRLNEQFHPGR